jgi:hypothetical protein
MHVTDKSSLSARHRAPSSWVSRRSHACPRRLNSKFGLTERFGQSSTTGVALILERRSSP